MPTAEHGVWLRLPTWRRIGAGFAFAVVSLMGLARLTSNGDSRSYGRVTLQSIRRLVVNDAASEGPGLNVTARQIVLGTNMTMHEIELSISTWDGGLTIVFFSSALLMVFCCASSGEARFNKPSLGPRDLFVMRPDGYDFIGRTGSLSEIFSTQIYINKFAVLLGLGAGLLLSTPESGAPVWLLLLSIPFVYRARLTELKLFPSFGGNFQSKDVLPFLFGSLETIEEVTHGITIAAMYAMDDSFHDGFVQSFEKSKILLVRGFAPVAGVVHVWGFAAMFLFLSQTMQFVQAHYIGDEPLVLTFDKDGKNELQGNQRRQDRDIHGSMNAAVAAESVGYTSLARRLSGFSSFGDAELDLIGRFFVAIPRVLFESCPQGLLATSCLMFLNESVSRNPVPLFSAVISAWFMLKTSLELFPLVVSSGAACCAFGAPVGAIFGISVWTLAKLYFIEVCPYHAWGVTTGCINLGNTTAVATG